MLAVEAGHGREYITSFVQLNLLVNVAGVCSL